jgi:hypothetical protein
MRENAADFFEGEDAASIEGIRYMLLHMTLNGDAKRKAAR